MWTPWLSYQKDEGAKVVVYDTPWYWLAARSLGNWLIGRRVLWRIGDPLGQWVGRNEHERSPLVFEVLMTPEAAEQVRVAVETYEYGAPSTTDVGQDPFT